jgi:hypothetical protein
MRDAFPILFIFVGIPLALGWIAKIFLQHQRFMKVLQLKAETNARMLDRFGNDQAFLDFLKSDGQQKMFDIRLPGPVVPAPYLRMLTAIQLGLVFFAIGIASLVLNAHLTYPNDQHPALFFGVLGISLGVGGLLSATAAYFVGQRWYSDKGEAA